jgi:hypothetical protein
MILTIKIDCDNGVGQYDGQWFIESAAFDEGMAGAECARLLRKVAGKIEDWRGVNDFTLGLVDVNGNKVGEAIADGEDAIDENEREVAGGSWCDEETDAERNA